MNNMYKKKLSIIVPVYNVEKYIVKCISSLLEQNYDDYEIIIVNDGTKDNSINLIQQHFNDSKLRIINQTNQGLSVARNTGLAESCGEYIWFFDSDDWVSAYILRDIVKCLHECDLLYFNVFYEETEKGSKIFQKLNQARTGRELSLCSYLHGAPFYIYRREFLKEHDLLFEKGIYHEDTLFTPCALYMANSVIPYDSPVYHRLLRKGSITHTINPKRCLDLCFVISKLKTFADKDVYAQDKYLWGNCIADATNGLLLLSINCNDKQVKENIQKFVNNEQVVHYLMHARKTNTRILGYISSLYFFKLHEVYNVLFKIRYFFKL